MVPQLCFHASPFTQPGNRPSAGDEQSGSGGLSSESGFRREVLRAAILLLLIPGSAPATDKVPPSPAGAGSEMPESILQVLSQPQDFQQRIDEISRKLLGRPYAGGPLGEGPDGLVDRDPRLRWDRFDCTTFVETVLASARSEHPDSVLAELDRIRYQRPGADSDSRPSFDRRAHFISLEWLPSNSGSGTLSDVTPSLAAAADVEFSVARTTIDRRAWLLLGARAQIQVPGGGAAAADSALARWAEGHTARTAEIPHISLRDARQVGKRLSFPAVVSVVRPNWDLAARIGSNLLVSHQVLLLPSSRGPIVRHASSHSSAQRVVEEGLESWLGRLERTTPDAGLHFARPMAPSPPRPSGPRATPNRATPPQPAPTSSHADDV